MIEIIYLMVATNRKSRVQNPFILQLHSNSSTQQCYSVTIVSTSQYFVPSSANATHVVVEPFIIATKSNRHAMPKTKLQIRNTEHPAPCKPENTRHQQDISTPENTVCIKQTLEKTTTAVVKKNTWLQQKK